MSRWILFPLVALALLTGCYGAPIQSALHPASGAAAEIARLWWLLFAICTAVFLIVMVLLVVAVYKGRGDHRETAVAEEPDDLPGQPLAPAFVIVSGILVPAVILLVIFIASLNTSHALRRPETTLTIRVIGHQFWWQVEYPEEGITVANELTIPVGQPVRLEMTSADVIHSFWVPRLNGKMDLNPGHTTNFWIAADRPGEYRGQCAEYCGVQHARMAFYVVALPQEAFRTWVAERQAVPAQPVGDLLRAGQEAFFRTGCDQCHAIRGTRAQGRIGPDLTHMGSRLTIGAGTLPNTRGNLKGWIANPQAVKPGNKMPQMHVSPRDLHLLAAFLESLK
jgi:cytochrome c oxidase subunit 2